MPINRHIKGTGGYVPLAGTLKRKHTPKGLNSTPNFVFGQYTDHASGDPTTAVPGVISIFPGQRTSTPRNITRNMSEKDRVSSSAGLRAAAMRRASAGNGSRFYLSCSNLQWLAN